MCCSRLQKAGESGFCLHTNRWRKRGGLSFFFHFLKSNQLMACVHVFLGARARLPADGFCKEEKQNFILKSAHLTKFIQRKQAPVHTHSSTMTNTCTHKPMHARTHAGVAATSVFSHKRKLKSLDIRRHFSSPLSSTFG